jgi:ribosomal protein L22
MSAEQDKDDVTPPDAPEAKKPAAKKAVKKPAKAAAKAKADEAKASEAKAADAEKPASKKAAKKPAAKEPVASEKKGRAKGAPKAPRRRVVRAHARYVRTSARKARMVCGHLRGKSVQEARAILAFTPREVARDWSKLLESAVANAESNHELLEEDLVIREAYADEGPTIKRFRPRAMGRATPIRKRTSHLTIALTTDAAQRTTKRNG